MASNAFVVNRIHSAHFTVITQVTELTHKFRGNIYGELTARKNGLLSDAFELWGQTLIGSLHTDTPLELPTESLSDIDEVLSPLGTPYEVLMECLKSHGPQVTKWSQKIKKHGIVEQDMKFEHCSPRVQLYP
jgi:hypothetical protein